MIIKDKIDYGIAIKKLNNATIDYDKGKPKMSDKEWDDLYFTVKEWEDKTGIVFKNSPTQHIPFEKVSELVKVKHNHPMLSLDKTKDTSDVKRLLGNKKYIAMAKLDGLTCSLYYKNGVLTRAETRGNGVEGEDITHNMLANRSVPNTIGTNVEDFVVDGELICTYSDFEEFKGEYKNPRNFASGSARLLDAKEHAKRNIIFLAWDVIQGFDDFGTLSRKLKRLEDFFGFYTVPREIGEDIEDIETTIEVLRENCSDLPLDGIVFKLDDIEEFESCGRTDHHFKGGIAFKFYDETYSTRLKTIHWSMGRTGRITPIAVFEPIEIDGTIVEKASLHNVGIMRELLGPCAYVGEPLEIYKANQIIPQVASAGPHHTYGEVIGAGGVSAHDVIEKCPVCGHEVDYIDDFVYCSNPNCDGKLINRIDHYCGKKGLDIKGLSKKTLEKLIDWEWITCLEDIYKLKDHRTEWIKKSGFGEKSVDKILDAIENSKQVELRHLLSAIGVHNISTTASIMLGDYFKTWDNFRKAVDEDFDFTVLPSFGTIADYDLNNYDYSEIDNIVKNYLTFTGVKDAGTATGSDLAGLTFCITGKVHHYKNRDEIKEVIRQNGGKVTDSVSPKTNYLINNDINSTTQKNQKARSLGIPIISEEEFIALMGN